MKLGIVGLPQSGKSTIFSALTGARGGGDTYSKSRSDLQIATVTVYDERLDFLKKLYNPKKSTFTQIEYILPSNLSSAVAGNAEAGSLTQVRVADAILHVVRNFSTPGGSPSTAEQDFWQLEEEMILSDLVVAEKRIEKLEFDKKRGKKPDGAEYSLLISCKEHLEKGHPLRNVPGLTQEQSLKGFTFLSAKPLQIIINNDDEDEELPEWNRVPENVESMVVRGRLEIDIASMSDEEAQEFRDEYNIKESALDRVIKTSFRILNRISFFTVSPEEVKAWSIPSGTPAVEAAGVVHSDMQKGFIRAEVINFDLLKELGSYKEAKKAGRVSLEGKEYIVKDGDMVQVRFNV